MRLWIGIAALVLLASPRFATASGCFGGQPDILPRNGSTNVPSNSRITIARRLPAGVTWIGPDGRQIAFRERQVGSSPSAARVLSSEGPLQPGTHTVRTIDPDLTHTFTVVPSVDSLPPRFSGVLNLEAHNSPEPSSECPENMFIRAGFPAPQDDGTDTNDLAFAVQIRAIGGKEPGTSELLLPAEAITGGRVYFRLGETGCGCIPKVKLDAGTTYRITVRAIDTAGNESTNSLTGTVIVPAAPGSAR
jgi:hypothetical protein